VIYTSDGLYRVCWQYHASVYTIEVGDERPWVYMKCIIEYFWPIQCSICGTLLMDDRFRWPENDTELLKQKTLCHSCFREKKREAMQEHIIDFKTKLSKKIKDLFHLPIKKSQKSSLLEREKKEVKRILKKKISWKSKVNELMKIADGNGGEKNDKS